MSAILYSTTEIEKRYNYRHIVTTLEFGNEEEINTAGIIHSLLTDM